MKIRVLMVVLVACLLAAPAAAGDWLYSLSEAVVVTGRAADGYATQHCLGAGVCREVMPLSRFDTPVQFAVVQSVATVTQLWLTRKLKASNHRTLALALNLGIGSGFLALGVRNQRLSQRIQP